MDTTSQRKAQIPPIQVACLVAAPLALVVGRTQLNLNWDDSSAYLSEMAANQTATGVGSLLTMVGSILLIPAVLVLTAIARTGAPRLAAVGGALAVLGAVSGIVVGTLALVGGQIARQGTDAGMVELWARIWSDGRVGPPLLVSGIVGFILLAVGLFRSGAVPRTAAVLVGLAGVATLVTSVGPLRPLVVGSAALAVGAFSWVAVVARRTASVTTPAPIARPVGT